MTFDEIQSAINSAFRDFVTAGVPASGDHDPIKQEVRAALALLVIALDDGGFSEPPDWAADLAEVVSKLEVIDAALNPLVAAAAASAAAAATAEAGAVAAEAGAVVAETGAESARDTAVAAEAGVLAALGGTPLSSVALAVKTRALLKAIDPVATGGVPVELLAVGDQSLFDWVPGDQSANVTADTYEALWIPPAGSTGLAANGTQGAWHRVHNGEALATWAGVQASGIGDYQPRIQSLLNHAEIWSVVLPRGTVGMGAAATVPSGKFLWGAAQETSFLKATTTTGYLAAVAVQGNAMVVLNGTGSRCYDFTVNGNKLGDHAIGGVHAYAAKRFWVARMTAKNCTAYAYWGVGANGDYSAEACNGVFYDCAAENSNVGFEATACDGVKFINPRYRDGDGDVPCETMFHTTDGARNVLFQNGDGVSSVATNGAHVMATGSEPMSGITFENTKIHVLNDTVAAPISAYANAVTGVRYLNCDIKCLGGAGVNPDPGTGSIEYELTGGKLQALGVGAAAPAGCKIKVTRTHIIMRNVSALATVTPLFVQNATEAIIDGPIIDTDRAYAYPQSFPSSRNITVVSPPVILVPVADMMPWGVGHKVRRVLAANVSQAAGEAPVAGLSFGALAVGNYLGRLRGSYQATTTNGMILKVSVGATAKIGGAIAFDTYADGSNRKVGSIGGTSGQAVSTASEANATSYGFTADFSVDVTAGSPSLDVQATPWNGGAAGTLQFDKGSIFELEMVG